jgi:hypothetical protein
VIDKWLAPNPRSDFLRSMNRKLLVLSFALLSPRTALHAAPEPQAARHPVRLVEFYTSEACASCLAADAAFARIAAEAHVIALGFHVAYWDYLGWKDRFALDVADQRQWNYAKRWHSGEVFTPEMIVNGTTSGIGNDPASIDAMIRRTPPVPRLGLSLDRQHVVVSIPALAHPAGAVLWITMFDRSRSVNIGHGENQGQVIQETDIVRFAAPFAVLAKAPAKISVPVADLGAPAGPVSYDGIVSFVQEPGYGPIIAAGRMSLSRTLTAFPK